MALPFTGPLSVTVGHLRIRFHGKGHRSIADRQLHMLIPYIARSQSVIFENFGPKMAPSSQN